MASQGRKPTGGKPNEQGSLGVQVQLWPTPSVQNEGQGLQKGTDVANQRRTDGEKAQIKLHHIAEVWPISPSSPQDRPTSTPGETSSPDDPTSRPLWATPTSLSYPQEGQTHNRAGQNILGVQLRKLTGNRRAKLNPRFVDWLMGLRPGWTDAQSRFGRAEMASYRSRLRSLLRSSLVAQGYQFAIPPVEMIETPASRRPQGGSVTERPYRLILGKCEQVLPTLPENYFDSISCDPPYHLGDPRPMTRAYPERDEEGVWDNEGRKRAEASKGFMGMKWDGGDIAFDPAMWRAALRVLKPGGYMVAFGGTRTYHRVATAIEEAGFILRDSIHWIYGSGFPKALNVERAIAVKTCPLPGRHFAATLPKEADRLPDDHICPPTPESIPWTGYFTALKPAHEPIILAQKPLQGTYVDNLLRWGVGALNIDGARSSIAPGDDIHAKNPHTVGTIGARGIYGAGVPTPYTVPEGRWPTNVILTHAADCTDELCAGDCPIGMLDAQNGIRRSTGGKGAGSGLIDNPAIYGKFSGANKGASAGGFGDSGGVSRYFPITRWEYEDDIVPFLYAAKASRSERELGLDHLATKTPGEATMRKDGQKGLENPRAGAGRTSGARNFHPTVKPLALIRWITKLVTPPGGLVLDHFAGSGTTVAAGVLDGFHVTAIEMTPEYLPIIAGRANYHAGRAEVARGHD